MLKSDVSFGENRTSSPFFSVVIPTYDTARYIAEALDSVFAQTLNDHEVIVVNDGSPDTVELEQELAPYKDRIIYVKQQHNGPGSARNTGIMRARGDYIAFLDSDDRWLKEHLAEMMSVLRQDPTLDLVYADSVNFGDPDSAGRSSMETSPSEGVANFESLVDEKCSVIASCVVGRRRAIIESGLFDENLLYGEDFDLWLRLAFRGAGIEYRRRVHSERRIHKGNLSADTVSSFEGQAQVLEKLLRDLVLSPSLRHKMKLAIERCRASAALEKGKQRMIARQYKRAWEEFLRANAFFRRRKLHLVLLLLRAAPQLVRHFYLRHGA